MSGSLPSRRAPEAPVIRILRDDVARKIAAGEVIDRPLSIVRELLDNSIDAGASSIDVFLEGGGISRVRVVDDGAGMGREDLQLCGKPHATSKIESEDDLLKVTSLGFRGEALSSIAAASRLEIVSARSQPGGAPVAHRLLVRGGKLQSIDESPGKGGTSVDVSELFYNYPARKKFLRGVSTESAMCRSMFVDRALPHPSIAFRLFSEGELRLSLPPSTLLERVALAYGQLLVAGLLRESTAEGEGFTVRMVAGLPELRRRDRKLVQAFVNRRRVSEFSLIQAAEYAFSGYVPGGHHPVAFVFVEVDPALVDFNIHPAKKEVRFRNLPDVHRAVVAAGRKLLASEQTGAAGVRASAVASAAVASAAIRAPAGEASPRADAAPAAGGQPIRFLGQVFGVFLAFELPGRLLLLDQHAAHERIIFDRLAGREPAPQEMLFPLSFDVSNEEDERIARTIGELRSLGMVLRRAGARTWELTAVSEDFLALGEGDLLEMLRAAGQGGEAWRRNLLAKAACRLAIKEGDSVDPVAARELCAQALGLESPRCPHGRPIWHEVLREELYRLVDRPVGDPAT
jgi:DNA mismatch repair protein MutL